VNEETIYVCTVLIVNGTPLTIPYVWKVYPIGKIFVTQEKNNKKMKGIELFRTSKTFHWNPVVGQTEVIVFVIMRAWITMRIKLYFTTGIEKNGSGSKRTIICVIKQKSRKE